MKLIFTLLLLISIESSASDYNPNLIQCEMPQFDLKKLSKELADIRANDFAGQFIGWTSEEYKVPFQSNDLSLTKELFDQIREEILGPNKVKLRFIEQNEISIESSYGIVNVGTGMVKHILHNPIYKNGRSLLAFSIAHEISHFAQDASRRLLRDVDHTAIEKTLAENAKKRGFNFEDKVVRNALWDNYSSSNHTEVDAYALLVLERMKIALPEKDDLKMLFQVFSNLREKSETREEKSLSDLYTKDMLKCSKKVRSEYVEQFKIDSQSMTLKY